MRETQDNTPGKAVPKDKKVQKAKQLPPDESGASPIHPSDERNSDQGKMQEVFDAQKRERMTRNGDKKKG